MQPTFSVSPTISRRPPIDTPLPLFAQLVPASREMADSDVPQAWPKAAFSSMSATTQVAPKNLNIRCLHPTCLEGMRPTNHVLYVCCLCRRVILKLKWAEGICFGDRCDPTVWSCSESCWSASIVVWLHGSGVV
jgi:hypothetical protein